MARRRPKSLLEKYAPLIAVVLVIGIVITGIILLTRGKGNDTVPEQTEQETVTEETEITEDLTDEEYDDGMTDTAEEETVTEEQEEEDAFDPSEYIPEDVEYGVFTGSRKATILSVGDTILHENIYKSYTVEGGFDFEPIFDSITPILSSADYTVANVDGPTGGSNGKGYSEYPQFNSPPQILNALKNAGVDMLTLANNHALDTYYDGLIRTIDNVESVGLDHIGAYRSKEEYNTPKVVDINGIKVGFTNYTVSTNNLANSSAPEASEYGLRMTSNSDIVKDVKALRNYGAEIVIVYMHWGKEYQRTPSKAIRSQAQKIAESGADVIIGGHPHMVQPAQWLTSTDSDGSTRQTLCLYSMGNFLSDQRQRYRDTGILFRITLQDNPETGKVEVVNPEYIPTYVWRVKAETNGYKYKVISAGQAANDRPSSMSDKAYNRVQQIVEETQANMNRTGVGTMVYK